MGKAVHYFARALGMASGAALAGIWTFALWVPAAGLKISGVSVVMALLLVAFALFGAIASAYGHAAVVILFFLASFFPIGEALLRVDHWLGWVGWIDLGLLAAAALLWLTRTHRAPPPQGTS